MEFLLFTFSFPIHYSRMAPLTDFGSRQMLAPDFRSYVADIFVDSRFSFRFLVPPAFFAFIIVSFGAD